jgi:transcriptional regulator GlxA family with amidase domain
MDTQRVAICLLPGASRLAAQAVAELLEGANGLLGALQYRVQLAPLAAIDLAQPWDQCWLAAPWRTLADSSLLPPLQQGLQRLASRQAPRCRLLGGLEGGVLWLAAAGLLQGRRACAADWMLPQLQLQLPLVVWTQALWELDDHDTAAPALLASCARPLAVPDLLLAWLARAHGAPLARRLGARMGLSQLRGSEERVLDQAPAHALVPPRLAEALALMQANLAEPLPTEELARLVGLSRRQLERLFKQHLHDLPSRHYLQLRLQRSRELLQRSGQSVLQVALACGFTSGPHFSNAYKAAFGCTPREERARELAGLQAGTAAGLPAGAAMGTPATPFTATGHAARYPARAAREP